MRRRLLPIGLVLLLALPLAWLLRDFARDVVLIEVLRVIWAANLLIRSLPHPLVWLAFLALAVVVAVRSLIRRKATAPAEEAAEPLRRGRLRALTDQIERAAQGKYFRWNLEQRLGDLALEVLAHRERTSPERVRLLLRAGALDAPPQLEAYAMATARPRFSRSSDLFSRLRRYLPWRRPTTAPDLELETLVAFLEDQLEVLHDH